MSVAECRGQLPSARGEPLNRSIWSPVNEYTLLVRWDNVAHWRSPEWRERRPPHSWQDGLFSWSAPRLFPWRPISCILYGMSRRCALTGKGPLSGNNVSHAHNKTRRVQRPNIQDKRLYVPELGRFVRVKLSTRALRTVNRKGLMQFLKDEGLTLKDVARPVSGR